MLGYLILVVVQIICAWFGAPMLLKYVPASIGATPIAFIHAAFFAVIVWLVGVVGSFVIKDVHLPSSRTLVWALAGALIGEGIVVSGLYNQIPLKFAPLFLPLGGAILGYIIRR
jgi:hypothetical protein